MGAPVPQITERVQNRDGELTQIKEDFVNGVPVVPQERVQNRSRDQFVDVPAVVQVVAWVRPVLGQGR